MPGKRQVIVSDVFRRIQPHSGCERQTDSSGEVS